MRTNERVDNDVMRAVETCLAELDGVGREAFNVYPSYYERVTVDPASQLIRQLRAMGVTSGISRDADEVAPRIRFHITPRALPRLSLASASSADSPAPSSTSVKMRPTSSGMISSSDR